MVQFRACNKLVVLIESVMELMPRQGNLRLVFRLFSLDYLVKKIQIMQGLQSIRLK